MKEAEINGFYIVVEGFTDVKIKDVDALLMMVRNISNDCYIQLFDADIVAGFEHIYFASLNAVNAFKTGRNISKELVVEILLYCSGQHQISKAINILGIKLSSSRIVTLVIADTQKKATKILASIATYLSAERCYDVINLNDQKIEKIKEVFMIEEQEIKATLKQSEEEAIILLLIERVALLSTKS